jgi:prepilin-type N-terminal cleavage/methylation domain-containing protein
MLMVKLKNFDKGFTLVELLIVIAIVGLLSTLIVISVSDSRTKSYDTRRLADINDLQKALTLYEADFERFPDGAGIALGQANYQCLSGYGFTAICPADGTRVFMAVVPQNPQQDLQPYIYTAVAGGESYTIEFETLTSISDITAGNHILTPEGIQ